MILLLYLLLNISVGKEIKDDSNNLRQLWDETIKFDLSSRTDLEDRNSINNHCKNSDYKYFIHYVAGQTYNFTQFINKDNAKPLINILTGEGEGNSASYVEHIGLFFFFVACAGVSIIVWVFNWICWVNQCCCCDFLHNPVNKRLVWWTSFIFLLGILACCISGFVTTNRFGFALEGSWCAFDRLYYDSKYGQLKDTYPKWEGFQQIINYINQLIEFIETIPDESSLEELINDINNFNKDFISNIIELKNEEDFCKLASSKTFPVTSRYSILLNSLNNLKLGNYYKKDLESYKNAFESVNKDFDRLKTNFLNEYYYYARVAKGCGKVLTMIYFCLLLIFSTFAGVSLMFYACLRRQGYLKIFMHVLWNVIRFFIFSFFFYGAAYGMCYLALRDSVAYVMFIFGEENLSRKYPFLLPQNEGKNFLHYCLIRTENDCSKQLDDTLRKSLSDFFLNYQELNLIKEEKNNYFLNYLINDFNIFGDNKEKIQNVANKQENILKIIFQKNLCSSDICSSFQKMATRDGGIFGSFNCTFLKSDLSMMFRTLYDLSVEARILCALSCCIAFFGAIFIYFFLLVLHHYDMELFFDNNKSIFIGIEGFGHTKKKHSNDPSYKKRKLRAEIELSSRNEEYSAYQPNKNED